MKGGIVTLALFVLGELFKREARIILTRALDCNTSRTADGW